MVCCERELPSPSAPGCGCGSELPHGLGLQQDIDFHQEAHLLQSRSGLIGTVLLYCRLSAAAKSKIHRCGLHLPLGEL